MSTMMYLRFPHGTEIHWASELPAVGHVVTHGSRRWVVLASGEETGYPTVVLGPHDDGDGAPTARTDAPPAGRRR